MRLYYVYDARSNFNRRVRWLLQVLRNSLLVDTTLHTGSELQHTVSVINVTRVKYIHGMYRLLYCNVRLKDKKLILRVERPHPVKAIHFIYIL